MAEVPIDTTPPQHGYETQDFNIRVVALFALSMIVVLAGSLALMAWLFDIFHATPGGYRLWGAPLASNPPQPPGPRLQSSPTRDFQEMLRTENTRLQSYGWVDRSAGMVRMPIDQAMQVVLERGLPSWHEIPTPQTDERSAPVQERR